ncbi:hypothetical protein VIGAN_04224400 [Vigna angularis var. angularis]|uniref:Uncharacterized protein n=1 Tax=Vigna angularis var. angularis TaxID=157739 RepID=A0A0S3RW31_PHAAN|nr:hypothetical protein VIGAN_04224400 [Vigna angularis var. angularis]
MFPKLPKYFSVSASILFLASSFVCACWNAQTASSIFFFQQPTSLSFPTSREFHVPSFSPCFLLHSSQLLNQLQQYLGALSSRPCCRWLPPSVCVFLHHRATFLLDRGCYWVLLPILDGVRASQACRNTSSHLRTWKCSPFTSAPPKLIPLWVI